MSLQTDSSIVTGPSGAPTQSTNPTQSDASTGEEGGSEELAQDEDIGLAPRDWTVVKICDRRDDVLPKVDEYQVLWARTRHPTAQFRVSTRRGRLRVKVDGRLWEIVSQGEPSPDQQTGEPETVVEWANTWHTIWELPSAFAAVAEFEMQNPRPDKQLTLGTKPDLRDWPLFLESFKDPEPEPEIDDSNDRIDEFVFEIEEDFDYTASFLHHCKSALRKSGRLVSPAIALLLCMPQRQRLRFNPEYMRANDTFSGSFKNWRILPVYIAGLAHRNPCSNCASAAPETLLFELCVNWEGVYAGSCVNCAYAGSKFSSTCDCRRGPWTWKQNARQIQLPEVRSDAAESTSSGGGLSSGGDVDSSVHLDGTEEAFTPLSEQYFPARYGKEGGEPGSSRRRRSGEFTAPAVAKPMPYLYVNPSVLRIEDTRTSGHGLDLPDESVGQDIDGAGAERTGPAIVADKPGIHLEPSARRTIFANGEVLQTTHGRFGIWSPDSASNKDVPSRPVAGPSRIPARNLSSRQLSKRPVASDTDASNEGDSRLKKTRRSIMDSALEDAANPPKAFKYEPTPSASQPPVERQPEYDVSHHRKCTKHPQEQCVDPTVGFKLPPYDKWNPPADVVYAHDDNWEPGALGDDNVKFIISRCPCIKTEYLHDAWKNMLHAKPSNGRWSKYTLLSNRYSDKLNLLIRLCCPSQPQRPGDVIEID